MHPPASASLFPFRGRQQPSSTKSSVKEGYVPFAGPQKPHPAKILGFYKVKNLLRSANARTRYNLDSLMFHVEYPRGSGFDEEFLSYDDIKHTEAWMKYEISHLTPRIGRCVGIDFDQQEIISYAGGRSVELKHANYEARFRYDRKRQNDGSEIATTHTPKKVCHPPPPPPISSFSTANCFPNEVINELKEKFDKHTVRSPSFAPPPPPIVMSEATPSKKGLVQYIDRNRNAPSYRTSNAPSYRSSTTSRSTLASRNFPSYRTSGTSIGSNLSNFDSGSLASTTSSNFSSSFVPKDEPTKKPDEKCSIC